MGLTIYAFRVPNAWWGAGVAALLGGAISHLGDRLFRDPGFAVGHIVDFIDYAGFFVGNVADIFLVLGAIYLVLVSLVQKDPSSAPDEPPRRRRSGEGVNTLTGKPIEQSGLVRDILDKEYTGRPRA